jgi:hypothetical protein
MSMRMLVRLLIVVAALVVGVVAYTYSTSKQAPAAADCAEKPKPKSEFAMAAECDAADAKPANAPSQAPGSH